MNQGVGLFFGGFLAASVPFLAWFVLSAISTGDFRLGLVIIGADIVASLIAVIRQQRRLASGLLCGTILALIAGVAIFYYAVSHITF